MDSRWRIFLLGLLIGACGMWVGAHFASPGFVLHDQVQILEGRTNGVNHDGTAIGFTGSGRVGEGYSIAGAMWRQDDGPWNESGPTCLVPDSSGQRVTLGVVQVPASADAPGRPVVVWLECHGAPT